MRRLVASSLVILATIGGLAAAPAVGQPQKKTELVALDGNQVDRIPLRHEITSVWLVDAQNILYRDAMRAYYLVTLEAACEPLTIKGRDFSFHPGNTWVLRTDRTYEVRLEAGPRCGVAKIARVDRSQAEGLRDASLHRVW